MARSGVAARGARRDLTPARAAPPGPAGQGASSTGGAPAASRSSSARLRSIPQR